VRNYFLGFHPKYGGKNGGIKILEHSAGILIQHALIRPPVTDNTNNAWAWARLLRLIWLFLKDTAAFG